ncbi:MAG TPA: hypothetical protein VNZ57_07490 [Longimicrobiales bacterium]|nr:hypothetical protein [Longimicrobiales bacterium]
MRARLRIGLLTMVLLIGGVSSAAAQTPGPLSLDLRLGRGFGRTTGEYRNNHDGTVGEAIVALRPLAIGPVGLVVAGGAADHSTATYTLECQPASNGGCVPSFPIFQIIMAQAGIETRGGTIRALAGPSLVWSEGNSAAGWSGHVTAAVRVAPWIWLVASAAGHVIPDFRGDSFDLASVGIGLRIR